MPQEFPALEAAIGTIMFRVLAETMTDGTQKDRMDDLEAVRNAIRRAWPGECKVSLRRTVWRATEHGGSQALYDETR
jgi:hypothetical protein